ncbi:MAG: peptidylprolyl isomerase [bacterium]
MSIIKRSTVAVLVFVGLMIGCSQLLFAQQVLDRIVAIVDKEIITESELNERVNIYAYQNRVEASQPGLKQQMLDAIMSEKLILAQAILDSVMVTEEEVTRAVDERIQEFLRQAGSEERLEQYFGKPVSRIKRDARPELRKQLIIMRFRQMKEATLQVGKRQIEEFYESYKDSIPKVPEQYELSHIFILPKPDSSLEAQAEKKLTAIRDSIVAGGDFADFAKRYSLDGSGAYGGDLGWAKRGVFVREFEESVFGLQEKEISPVIKTDFGFHVIQLMERRGESVHARHILLRVERGAASDSAAVNQLRQLKVRIQNGESFPVLARQYSQDEDTKIAGGDLGLVTLDQLDADFATVVKGLQDGQISEPHRITFKTNYGFQIVQLRKQIPEHKASLEKDYKLIERYTMVMLRNRKFAELVEAMKKNIYWEIRL